MQLPTVSTLHYAKSPTMPVRLDHDLQPTNKSQARLRDRVALVPRIDLDDFRFDAVVDWIEFEMTFSRGVQIQTVQLVLVKALGKTCHVDRLDLGSGSVFRRCRIKVQEPERMARILEAHQALVQEFGEVRPSRITGIEISLDAYPKVPDPTTRALLLGAMQRTFWTKRDIWSERASGPRFATDSKHEHMIPGPQWDSNGERRTNADKYSAAPVDATMYVGAKSDTVMTRIMDKVIDKQRPDGNFDALTDDRKRVRIEVTLTGTEIDELGLSDVQSFAAFRFTNLQGRYFQFKLATLENCTPIRFTERVVREYFNVRSADIYLRAGVLGFLQLNEASKIRRDLILKRARTTSPELKRNRSVRQALPLISFEALNRKVATAFQHLDKREQRAFESKAAKCKQAADE